MFAKGRKQAGVKRAEAAPLCGRGRVGSQASLVLCCQSACLFNEEFREKNAKLKMSSVNKFIQGPTMWSYGPS